MAFTSAEVSALHGRRPASDTPETTSATGRGPGPASRMAALWSVNPPWRAEQAGDLGHGCAAWPDVAHDGARGPVPGFGRDQLEGDLLVAEIGGCEVPELVQVQPPAAGGGGVLLEQDPGAVIAQASPAGVRSGVASALTAPRSSTAGSPAACRLARQLRAGRLLQHPRDFLPGDRQPRGLLPGPGQFLRKLFHPAAQPVRLGPGSRFPPLEFLDQGTPPPPLCPSYDGRRPRHRSAGNPAKLQVRSPSKRAAPKSVRPCSPRPVRSRLSSPQGTLEVRLRPPRQSPR